MTFMEFLYKTIREEKGMQENRATVGFINHALIKLIVFHRLELERSRNIITSDMTVLLLI